MQIKLSSRKQIRNVRLIFGTGVTSFLDKGRKFLYIVRNASLNTIHMRHHHIGILKFPVSNIDRWMEFKLSRIQKDSMVLSYTENDRILCYKVKIPIAVIIHNLAYMIVILEDINEEYNEIYWKTYLERYHNINEFITKNGLYCMSDAYLLIDHF